MKTISHLILIFIGILMLVAIALPDLDFFHSSYFWIVYGLGIIGLIFVVFVDVKEWKKARKKS